MEWKTPKTDWQSSDRYDYREINKLNDNLSIVEKETEKIFDFYAPKNTQNLIPFPYYDVASITRNGITFTTNADGSVTANGTATANTFYYIDARLDTLDITQKGKMYHLSGCPSGGSDTSYNLAFFEYASDKSTTVQSVRDYGNGDSFASLEHYATAMVITIYSGQTVNNLVFKPMLTCEESQYKPTDIPYASTFNEIEERLHAVNGAGYGYDIGAKKTYVANQPVMDSAELNRVESALERLHIENQNNIEILPKLTFRLGNVRGVKI